MKTLSEFLAEVSALHVVDPLGMDPKGQPRKKRLTPKQAWMVDPMKSGKTPEQMADAVAKGDPSKRGLGFAVARKKYNKDHGITPAPKKPKKPRKSKSKA